MSKRSAWSELKNKASDEFCPKKPTDICYNCSQKYDVVDNIGMFRCTFHPGTYDEDTGWSCCRKKKRRLRYRTFQGFEKVQVRRERHSGCTPCDHNHCSAEEVELASHVHLTNYLSQYAEEMSERGAITNDYRVRRYQRSSNQD